MITGPFLFGGTIQFRNDKSDIEFGVASARLDLSLLNPPFTAMSECRPA